MLDIINTLQIARTCYNIIDNSLRSPNSSEKKSTMDPITFHKNEKKSVCVLVYIDRKSTCCWRATCSLSLEACFLIASIHKSIDGDWIWIMYIHTSIFTDFYAIDAEEEREILLKNWIGESTARSLNWFDLVCDSNSARSLNWFDF